MLQFNLDEVFEIAELVERNGGRFYRWAADVVAEPDGRRLLLGLAEMEDDHVAIFAAMRKELVTEADLESDLPRDEAASLYLQALADEQIFDPREDPIEQMRGRSDLLGIIELALQMEQRAIAFYTALQRVTPKRVGGEKIEQILLEEMRHVSMLTLARKNLEAAVAARTGEA